MVYVGGLSEQRGALKMIEALALVNRPDVDLTLVGPVYSSSRLSELEAKIGKLGLTDLVTMTGRLPFEEAQKIVGMADIGLVLLKPVANYVGSLPTKLFEYMCAGLPVIASDFPLWSEIVVGESCGLVVDPLDEKAIAGAIVRLLDDPDEAEAMGANGRRAVAERYNWKREETTLFNLYDKLIGAADDQLAEKKRTHASPRS